MAAAKKSTKATPGDKDDPFANMTLEELKEQDISAKLFSMIEGSDFDKKLD